MSRLVPFNRRNGSIMNGIDGFYNMVDDFFNDNMPFIRGFSNETFKVDVEEKEKEFLVEAELPGVHKEQIHLELHEGRLNISVKKEEEVQEEKKNYIHRERRLSSMSRSLYLDNVKSEGIKAKMENGVLSIRVPKENNKQNKRIIDIE